MPAPPPDARSFPATVRSVRPCGDDGVVLAIEPDASLAVPRAARFFMLRREDALSPAIPRPFSLYRQGAQGALEFLIKVTGPGTRALAEAAPGTRLRAVGPLGNGWSLPGDARHAVLLAGGIGSAPFFLLVEQALAGWAGAPPVERGRLTLIYGAATRGLLYDLEAFESLGARTLTATIDGSHGLRGNVLDVLEQQWSAGLVPRDARLYACGPDPMLAAAARLAERHELECWLSLETVMGCGVGICNGCAVFTRPEGELAAWPVAKCCVEGPVFRSRDIRYGVAHLVARSRQVGTARRSAEL